MSRETNRTNTSAKTRVRAPEESRIHPLMRKIGQYNYAAVCIPFLRVLQNPILAVRGRALRVVFVLIERSWGTLIPPPNYKGDGSNRRGWEPSEYAVRDAKQTKYGHWIIDPFRVKDIAEQLGEDEGNVSKELTWLESMGILRTQGKRYALNPTPTLKGSSKVVTDDNFFSEDPLYQQLENIRQQIETELAQAKLAALEPVIQKYQPKLAEVNTLQKRRKRELKKQRKQTTSPVEVANADNFSGSSPSESTRESTPTPGAQTIAGETEVVTHDNFSELSPIPRVVTGDNFQPALNIGSKYTYRNNNNRGGGDGTGNSVVVVAPVLAALSKYGKTTEPAAARLIAECQKTYSEVSAAEIVAAIDDMAAGFGRSTKNPVGVLLTQIPHAIKPTTKAAKRPPASELRAMLLSSDRNTRSHAARMILRHPDASAQDRADAEELLQALQSA